MPARDPSCEQRVRAICTEWGWHLAQHGDTALGLISLTVTQGRTVRLAGRPGRTAAEAWANAERGIRERLLHHHCRTEAP